ncbi:MAG: hypothetical protein U0169_25955 [Polyangiaceae bacterium]
MSKVANSRAIADALRAHAVALTATADALESAPPSSERSEYVDQHTSPLSKVVYLKFAKAGAFPSRKVGKRVLALREDFEVFLATHERKRPGPRPTLGASVDDQVLVELGVRRVADGDR